MQVLSKIDTAIGVERVTAPEDHVGESPVWRAAEGALYWVDIPQRRIHRLHLESGRRDSWRTDEPVACIAFEDEARVVAGMQSGIFALELRGDSTVSARLLAAPTFAMPGMRFNDGRCDRQGRFWAGTMHTDMPAAHAVGALYRYTGAEGLSAAVRRGLLTQNGLAWSPTGARMYLSDSHPKARVVWVFDYDCDSGTPYRRRVFVDMKDEIGRPDGAAVDVDGCYWTCANDAGEVLRYTPGGRLDRRVALPVRKPTMCAFGGAGLDTLYVTSIAGPVFALRPGVQGLAETEFAASR